MSEKGAETVGLGLSAQGLHDIFPFYFAIDRELRLVQFGRSLPKVCQNLQVGAPFPALFSISRPRIKPTLEALLRARTNTFFLDSVTQPVRMRGQLYYDQHSELLLFLGAPWFTDLDALQHTTLLLSDFTVHDPIVDFLYLVQAKSIALADAQKMSEISSKQRDELAEVNNQLEQAIAAKSQFLANTSHELRTPLNGIIGMASLLTRMKLSSQQRHYADTILKSGRTLLAVVNDILDISKIEAGRMTLEEIDFNVHRLLSETIDGISVTAQNKGLELIYVIDKDLPSSLQGDPTRIGQVLNNLLGNAVKFTKTGEVVARISRTPAPAPEIGLRIEVRDTGIGIAPADLARIFRPFSQADASMSRRFGGTGLGLALCREIASLMGGEIGVTSTEGVGSTFWFTARLRASDRHLTPHPGIRENFLDKTRVLLVDDNASNREYVQELVRQWGGSCVAVDSGVRAIDSLRGAVMENRPYDLMILDMLMPGMSGMELVSVLAGDALFDDLLLVMLSSLDPGARQKLPQRKRINAHLTKPIHPSALRENLAELLRARTAKTSVLSWTSAEESGDAIAAVDLSAELPSSEARVLVVDDNPVNLEVAARMLETLGYRSDMATNGAEALQQLEQQPYALVLMDLQMPVMSGYEATAAIRVREGTGKRLPIIAMTAHAMPADRRRALDGGMDDYISKPIELETLAALMSQWMPGRAGASSRDSASARRLHEEPSDSPVIDRSALEQLRKFQSATGEDLVAKVLRTFLADLTQRTQVAIAAAAQRDLRTLGQVGHALKSSSKLVGAHELSTVSSELAGCFELTDRASVEALVQRFLLAAKRVQTALGSQASEAPRDTTAPPAERPEQRATTRSQFFAELLHESGAHPALRHPLLGRLGSERLSRAQLSSFAAQHYMYSRNLGRNLGAVLGNLPDEEVRSQLIALMYEAAGETLYSPEQIQLQLLRARRITPEQLALAYAELLTHDSDADVVKVLLQQGHLSAAVLNDFRVMAEHRTREQSEPALLRKFLRSVGLELSELANCEPLPETAHCIDEYYQLCRSSAWQEAIVAIGVGAEWLLPGLCALMGPAVERSGFMPVVNATYFTLQVEQSPSRRARVIKALTPYADSPETRRRIAASFRRALDSRQLWYDGLGQLLFGTLVT